MSTGILATTLRVLGAGLIVSLGLTPAGAQTVTEKAYQQARAVLDAALQAAGGAEALRAVKDVTRIGRGTAFNQGQSLKPDAPYTTRTLETTSAVDFARRRSTTDSATTPAGGIPTRSSTVFKEDAGFTVNRVTAVLTPMAAGGVSATRAALRRDPVALLLTADSRAETLRFLGEAPFSGRPHRVIAFADGDGTQIALYVDSQSGLVSKYETLAANPVLGDVVGEVLYSDYRQVGGVKVPFRVVNRTAGEVTQELAYSEVKVNAGVADTLFDAPTEAVRASAPAGGTTVTLTKLGDDAYFVGGGSHNSLFVVFSDHVLLVEAPLNDERTQAVLAKIRETVGDKPVRYVVPTHYHFDHSGGLRGAIAAGATVVTTAGNRTFIERVAAAPQTVRPDALSRSPRKAVVETFSGKRVFSDGARTLELHEVGPSPHVDEVLVAYLPKERVLFVSDLFSIPADGPIPPGSPANRDFAEKLRRLGLAVDRIAPGHGRLGTLEELHAAVAKPGPSS